jgi:protein-disulfide isomerase
VKTTWESELTVPVQEGRDHIQGPVDAPLTLIEYGDYECPYWGRAYTIVKEVQKRLRDDDLHRYAEELGLHVDRFDQEMAEHTYAERVHEDFMGGVRSGVNGTPTFYVNGERLGGSYEPDDLIAALER